MAKELTKSILILSAEPRAMLPAEQFLVNRDWIVRTISDERMALSTLVENTPSFFMISVEHPNRKVLGLQRLLSQTLPNLKVIYFAETNSLESYRLLNQMEQSVRIYPPVTGPAVERAVNRFVKADYEKRLQEELYMKSLRRMAGEGAENLTWAPIKDETQSLIFRGANQVLEEIVEKKDGVVLEKLQGSTTNTACIAIESTRFSGYLIAALAGDRPFDEKFVALVRERLVRFLRENGETVKEGESFPLKIRQVRFEAWAQDYAEFLKKTVHQGQEMAFAFFPVSEVVPTIGGSSVAQMVTIPVGALVADQEVDFHVHLLLPANDRFLLYTPKGSVFFKTQKDRLQKSGVASLHIKESDVAAFKAYHVRHQVEHLILDFEQRQRSLG